MAATVAEGVSMATASRIAAADDARGGKADVVPDWIARHQQIAITATFVLIFLYVLPILLVAAAAWRTEGFQEESFMLSWFAAFMHSSTVTLNEFHKVLFPMITGLSIVVFRGQPNRAFVALGVFTLLAFVTSTFVGVLFDIPHLQKAIEGLQGAPLDLSLVKTFFARVQETLMVYLTTLLGIGVANARTA